MALTSRHWKTLVILALVQFLHIVDFMILMPLGPQLMREFSIGTKEFGYLVAAYSFAAAVAGVLASQKLNTFKRKPTLLFLLTFFLMGTLGCALAPGYLWLLTARFVSGAFGGLLGAQSYLILGEAIPPEQRGVATGFLMSAFSFASVAGVPLGLTVAAHSSWHAPFLGLVGTGCLLFVAAFFLLPESSPQDRRGAITTSAADPSEESLWLSISSTFRAKGHAWGFLLSFCVILAGFLVIPYLSPFLIGNRGVSEAQLPLVYLCGGIATLVTGPLIGKWVDRAGAYNALFKVSLLSMVPLLLISFLDFLFPHVLPLPVLLLMTTSFMILISGRMVPTMTMLNQSVVPKFRGAFLSLNSSVQMIATGSGATIGGLLISRSSGEDSALVGYERLGVLAVAMTLLALWTARRLSVSQAK